jgi:hypothetical protein
VGDALAGEVDVVIADVAGRIRFVENFAARAVPIDLTARFLKTVAVAIIGVFFC